jgi:hypothetical protein
VIIAEKIQDRVAIIYGRFQPPTKGHYGMIKQAVEKYQQVFVLPVQGEAAFKTKLKTQAGRGRDIARKLERSPFPVGIRTQLLQKAFPELDAKNILKASAGSITHVYETLKRMYPKKDFSKLTIFAGSDEIDAYKRQAESMIGKDEYEHLDIEVKEYDAGTRETVSATKLREAIANPDKMAGFNSYKELAAPPLANMETFEMLRSKLAKIRKLNIEESILAGINKMTVKNKIDNKVKSVLMRRLKDWWAHQEHEDYIKKGPFKNYDDAYHRDSGVSASDEPAEGDYSMMDSATTDEVARTLWNKSDVEDLHYKIKAKDWKEFWKKYYKQLGVKVKFPPKPGVEE